MKKLTQTFIAQQIGVSSAYVNYLVNCKKRPNWQTAKKLAEVTKTDPILWLEGTSDEIKQALSQSNPNVKEKVA
ncbi:MAG: helix-turn-helix transcriptional regulator [Desulfobacula sp.]|jgi:transcriptional regulator with XRE-family HTH domain|uniref:helix-turn-helix domain-containing protein n=1 Tax=Desulfobacula sp. TaxID=2593537 RepID=UPI001DE0EFD7|nr:helix-turn-helix transcriptional regulator [Desulfobacula sp.]MBT3486399.1 helix-turn-helix transcriptional regulator [Desulfobacula sp.]MBT3805375.1 helix-turn-helix transcriptional regulator [Desulfobacula sp.]MBT4024529.1 helix-turn-helix transcriptional regulator [Desulfobacula sp.]MBT4199845.1 helix-turn-helix transcriptional regulator [Desulfobacula sp.]